jgi:hypothetical protein
MTFTAVETHAEFDQFLTDEIKKVNAFGDVIEPQDETEIRDGCRK